VVVLGAFSVVFRDESRVRPQETWLPPPAASSTGRLAAQARSGQAPGQPVNQAAAQAGTREVPSPALSASAANASAPQTAQRAAAARQTTHTGVPPAPPPAIEMPAALGNVPASASGPMGLPKTGGSSGVPGQFVAQPAAPPPSEQGAVTVPVQEEQGAPAAASVAAAAALPKGQGTRAAYGELSQDRTLLQRNRNLRGLGAPGAVGAAGSGTKGAAGATIARAPGGASAAAGSDAAGGPAAAQGGSSAPSAASASGAGSGSASSGKGGPRADKQAVSDAQAVLEQQVECLRGKCTKPGIDILRDGLRLYDLAYERALKDVQAAMQRLNSDAGFFAGRDPDVAASLKSFLDQNFSGQNDTAVAVALNRARKQAAAAQKCLLPLRNEPNLPWAKQSEDCHDQAQRALASAWEVQSLLETVRGQGQAYFASLVQLLRPGSSRRAAEERLGQTEALLDRSLAGAALALEKPVDPAWRSMAVLGKARALRDVARGAQDQIHGVWLWETSGILDTDPAQQALEQMLDQAVRGLELAALAWDKVAAVDKVDPAGAVVDASRQTVAALAGLKDYRKLFQSLQAKAQGGKAKVKALSGAACAKRSKG